MCVCVCVKGTPLESLMGAPSLSREWWRVAVEPGGVLHALPRAAAAAGQAAYTGVAGAAAGAEVGAEVKAADAGSSPSGAV